MYSWTVADKVIGLLVFAFFSFIGIGIPIILIGEYLLRPVRMKKIADEFKLSYQRNDGTISDSGKRNIIKGQIGLHAVELYDVGKPNDKGIETYFTLHGIPVRSLRYTNLVIDGKEEILKGLISGYCSVGKIRQQLLTMKQQVAIA